MLRDILKTTVFIGILTLVSNNIFAQDNKIDFKAEWKMDSINNIIKVTIINGDPINIMLYDNAPLDNGKLISKSKFIQSLGNFRARHEELP